MLKNTLLNCISINEEKFELTITSNLSREDYLELKSYLQLIEGKYQTSGKKFVFKINPKPLINAYIKTEIMPKKNPTAFFPTPSNLVRDMFIISDFLNIPNDKEYQSKLKVLEPSAGVAGIADLIREITPYVQLDIVEILDINQEILRQKGYEPICIDFMKYNIDLSIKYNYIVMNPPFQGKTYIKHIKHAYDMLNELGTLVAIVPTSFLNQDDKESLWLYEKVSQIGEIQHNSKGSFKEQGTNIDTCIICINKYLENWRKNEYQGCKNYWTWQVWLSLYCSQNTHNYFEKLEHNSEIKESIKQYILQRLDDYKKEYIYYSYEHIHLYVEKLYEFYCEMNDDLKDEDEFMIEEDKEEVSIAPSIYDEVILNTFASGKLF